MKAPKTVRRPGLRIILLTSFGALLAWLVVTHSVAAYLAATSPEAALELRANEPLALVNVVARKLAKRRSELKATSQPEANGKDNDDTSSPAAEDRVSQWSELAGKASGSGTAAPQASGAASGQPPNPSRPTWKPFDPDFALKVRPLLELALANDPLNARALRLLAQVAPTEERAGQLMQAAAQRSIGESIAVFHSLRQAYGKGNYETALYYADALLRTRSQYEPRVIPFVARMAEIGEANAHVKHLLATNPPWRGAFFTQVSSAITDARTPLDLLLALRDSGAPPTAKELSGYLNFLISRNFHELAYYAWLQFLPPEQLTKTGLLFNGSFEVPLSGLPFDWTISSGSGVTIDIVARPDRDGEQALFVEFGHGRVDFRDVSQLTMLPPGTYRLQVKYRGELLGRRGLIWRVACTGSRNDVLGESTMTTGIARDWEDMEFSFTVPETGCRAQYVRLTLDARSASERLVSGKLWYDDLRVTRAEPTKDPT